MEGIHVVSNHDLVQHVGLLLLLLLHAVLLSVAHVCLRDERRGAVLVGPLVLDALALALLLLLALLVDGAEDAGGEADGEREADLRDDYDVDGDARLPGVAEVERLLLCGLECAG